LRILLGITGGIAAYKAAGLVRALSELGHDVTVLPTENALRFIGKPTLEALSGHAIDLDLYSDVASVRHVELGAQADLVLIAPATASFLGRLASGIADDLLTNAVMASKAPVVVCPAMHTEMWENAATVRNVRMLEDQGVRIMPPAVGRLTGEDSGVGRLPEIDDIISFALGPMILSGKRVVVTAGGTREPIDEVRFIGNSSSGRMGLEIAKAARDLGAAVTLIAANLEAVPAGMEVIRVSTVSELEQALDRESDLLVMAAAVSDFEVANPYRGKLSRSQTPNLELTPTKDLLAGYAARHPQSFCVGFALVEAGGDIEKTARQKLWDKGCQVVIGNSSAALGAIETEVVFVTAKEAVALSGTKERVARELLGRVSKMLVG
jgi:phosphopantothenoylcysteine decarboxylase/phosphopantothenate--cysteine ligase